MTPDRLTRIEQAVGKLATCINKLASYVAPQYDTRGIQLAIYEIGNEANEIARQFSPPTPEVKRDEG